MSAQDMKEPVRTLLTQWTEALTQVLEAMTDQKPEVKWQAGITLAADPEALWWEQPFQISPEVIVWVAAPQHTWEQAGTITLQAAGLETVELSEARSTWLEILGKLSVEWRGRSGPWWAARLPARLVVNVRRKPRQKPARRFPSNSTTRLWRRSGSGSARDWFRWSAAHSQFLVRWRMLSRRRRKANGQASPPRRIGRRLQPRWN